MSGLHRVGTWGLCYTAGRSMAADLQRRSSCHTGSPWYWELIWHLSNVAASSVQEVDASCTHWRFDLS